MSINFDTRNLSFSCYLAQRFLTSLISCNMLSYNNLRQILPADLVVSLLVPILYVKDSSSLLCRYLYSSSAAKSRMYALWISLIWTSVHLPRLYWANHSWSWTVRVSRFANIFLPFFLPLSRVGQSMILGPQLIHHEPNNPVVRTTANVVSHMDVEQGKRSIGLRMVSEASLVGIGVDLLLDRFSLRRLSHFFSLFLFPVFYQTFSTCQSPLWGITSSNEKTWGWTLDQDTC